MFGTLRNVAWEDASINGQQVQASASLDGLCEWVSCCLDTNDGGGSNIIAGLMTMSGGVGGGGKTVQVKNRYTDFGGIKNVRKKRGHFFHMIFTTRPSLESLRSFLFKYKTLQSPSFHININLKELSCHESKTSFFEYVR